MPRMFRLPMLLLAPLSASCQTFVQTPPAECSEFIPESWREPVPSAPLPEPVPPTPAPANATELDVTKLLLMDATETSKRWMSFGVAQSGQLSKANGRMADTLHIFGECEKRANAARPRKKILGIL